MRNYARIAAAAAAGLFLSVLCCGTARAEDFRMWLEVKEMQPAGFTLSELPWRIDVVIENISDSAQPLYQQANIGPQGSITLEMTADDGESFEVKRRQEDTAIFDDLVSQYLEPGEKMTIPLAVSPPDWEDVPQPGAAKTYKTRVVYQNDVDRIYSDYYDITLDAGSVKEEAEEPDTQD